MRERFESGENCFLGKDDVEVFFGRKGWGNGEARGPD